MTWGVLEGKLGLGLGLFLFGVALDILDGWVARREGPTVLGQLLDPFVDKVFYFALCVAFHVIGVLPILAILLFLVPQLGIGIGTIVLWRRKAQLRARWAGKAAAALTALATGLLFLTPQGVWVYWVAIAAQFGAGVYYLLRQARRGTPEAAGPEIHANPRH